MTSFSFIASNHLINVGENQCVASWSRGLNNIEIKVFNQYVEDVSTWVHEFSEIAICNIISDDLSWVVDEMMEDIGEEKEELKQ